MLICIDESGSINNHNPNTPYFVISLVHVIDEDKTQRAFNRFVSSTPERLRELDRDRINSRGKIKRTGGKMFKDGKFLELKGTQFNRDMKCKFLEYFAKDPHFEVFFIKISNANIQDQFCKNTARVFNYSLRLALGYFIRRGMLPNEECILKLDERNERTESKYFLENYLNTELIMNGSCKGPFLVRYFDSAKNSLIQIADVYANWFYSHLRTGAYATELQQQKDAGIVKGIFKFPL